MVRLNNQHIFIGTVRKYTDAHADDKTGYKDYTTHNIIFSLLMDRFQMSTLSVHLPIVSSLGIKYTFLTNKLPG